MLKRSLSWTAIALVALLSVTACQPLDGSSSDDKKKVLPAAPGVPGGKPKMPELNPPLPSDAGSWTWAVVIHEDNLPKDDNDDVRRDSTIVHQIFSFRVEASVQDPTNPGAHNKPFVSPYPYISNLALAPWTHTIWYEPGMFLTSTLDAALPQEADYSLACYGLHNGVVAMSSREGVSRCRLRYPADIGNMEIAPLGTDKK